jgi:hypothetical protein
MTNPDRHDRSRSGIGLVGLAAIALVMAACGSATGSSAPVPSPSPAPTASAAPTVGPSATTTPTASATPAPTAAASSSSAACVVEPQTGIVPSDRLTGITVLGLPGRDIVKFGFGAASLTPVGPPTGSLAVASPPFTEGGSGLPIVLNGDHALQVVFKGMSIMNDVGQPTFTGERQINVTDAARSLRQVIVFDEAEGQIGWYVGYDGASCVTLSREGDAILLTIDFGPGS